jgi:hypothetical protein
MRLVSRCSLLLAAWLSAPGGALALDALCQEPLQLTQEGEATELDVQLAPSLPASAPGSDGEVPWCTSADDPRCAPLDSRHEATHARAASPLCAARGLRIAPPLLLIRPSGRVLDRSEARPGHGRRIERPPQHNRCD